MKKFYKPVSFKCESPEQMERLAKELEKLGCKISKLFSASEFDVRPLLVTNLDGAAGQVCNISKCFATEYNRHLCQSEAEFIALAAMVDDDKFYVGECVYETWETSPRFGEMFQVTREVGNNIYYSRGGFCFSKNLRKATDAEIISHFRKSEPNNKEPEFKVGDVVEIISWYFDKIKLPQKGVITSIDMDDDVPYEIEIEEDMNGNRERWNFKEGEFIKKKVEPNNKEPFTVEGSTFLRTALINNLRELGVVDRHYMEATFARDIYLTPGKDNKGNNAIAASEGIKAAIHYKLPEQYNEALQAFIDFYKEEKPREVEVTLSNGAKVIVKDGEVSYKGRLLAIGEIHNVHAALSAEIEIGYKITLKAYIATDCSEGMEVTAQDTKLILDTHAKNFE